MPLQRSRLNLPRSENDVSKINVTDVTCEVKDEYCVGFGFGGTEQRNREIKLNYGAFDPWRLK